MEPRLLDVVRADDRGRLERDPEEHHLRACPWDASRRSVGAETEGEGLVDFDFSADQYGLRDEARRFLEKQCPIAHTREFLDDPSGWSRDLWKQMADLGWMALPFPEKYGGLGQSFLDLV